MTTLGESKEQTKVCKRCGESKVLDDFHRWKKTIDGRRTTCKVCRALDAKSGTAREQRAARYQRNPEPTKARQRVYNAARREENRARSKASYAADPVLGRARNRASAARHPERVRANNASYRAKHSDRLKASDKAYAAANRPKKNAYERNRRKTHPEWEKSKRHTRRARKRAGGRFSASEWRNLCAFYDHACIGCGECNVKLTPDHVVPLCHGGSNQIENIQPLCLPCNLGKHCRSTDHRRTLPPWFRSPSPAVEKAA